MHQNTGNFKPAEPYARIAKAKYRIDERTLLDGSIKFIVQSKDCNSKTAQWHDKRTWSCLDKAKQHVNMMSGVTVESFKHVSSFEVKRDSVIVVKHSH